MRLGRLQKKSRYQQFYHEGSQAKDLFILVSGTVRLSRRPRPEGRKSQSSRRLCVAWRRWRRSLLTTRAEQQGPSYSHRLEGAMAVRAVNLPADTIGGDTRAHPEIAAKSPFSYFKPLQKSWERE